MKRASWLALAVIVAQGAVSMAHADGWGPTAASNNPADGIAGTRHNLTMSYLEATMPEALVFMGGVRNDYGEVCVYCHTPHGANNSAGGMGMPLWNRTVNPGLSYILYSEPEGSTPTTLQLAGEQTVTHPGPASLTCLSCHDGVTAIDSIINMPGSGGTRYMASQETSVNDGFLSGWDPASVAHYSLGSCASVCHNPGDSPSDFQNFVIGAGTGPDGEYIPQLGNVVDLSDDHPVGVLYPTALTSELWVDFEPMDVEIPGRYAFFDNGDGRANKNEIRVYDSGDGFEVECASCHDPHGVPNVDNSEFIPSFLRVSNAGSTLCLTCHIK